MEGNVLEKRNPRQLPEEPLGLAATGSSGVVSTRPATDEPVRAVIGRLFGDDVMGGQCGVDLRADVPQIDLFGSFDIQAAHCHRGEVHGLWRVDVHVTHRLHDLLGRPLGEGVHDAGLLQHGVDLEECRV